MSSRSNSSSLSMSRMLTTRNMQRTIESRGGYTSREAAMLADVAQQQLHEIYISTGEPVTIHQLVDGIKRLATTEVERVHADKEASDVETSDMEMDEMGEDEEGKQDTNNESYRQDDDGMKEDENEEDGDEEEDEEEEDGYDGDKEEGEEGEEEEEENIDGNEEEDEDDSGGGEKKFEDGEMDDDEENVESDTTHGDEEEENGDGIYKDDIDNSNEEEEEESDAEPTTRGGPIDGDVGMLDQTYDFEDLPAFSLEYWWSRLQTSGIEVGNIAAEGGYTVKKFTFQDWVLDTHWAGIDPYGTPGQRGIAQQHQGRDFLTAMCQCTELAIELGKHLRATDIVTLFSVSRAFNYAVSDHLLSSIKKWIEYKAPEAGRVFPFQLYQRLLVPDPTGRTWYDVENVGAFRETVANATTATATTAPMSRRIPGLRYMQMVVERDRYCREIIAIMARHGHLMPRTMHRSLLRLWLLMEIATSRQRSAFLQNKAIWTNYDLYNVQLFFVKLALHFNDPVYGPSTHDLVHLMLGQKGLYTLWQLLMRKRFTNLAEIVNLKTRYDGHIPNRNPIWQQHHNRIHGVSMHRVGAGHYEGWGRGIEHLARPDELIPVEAIRRGLELDKHLMHMVLWGYFDWKTGENIVPTEEDMYISDDERVLAHVDTTHHWKPRHAMKKRFDKLTPEQQRAIVEEDEDDHLRALPWCGSGSEVDDFDDDHDHDDDDDDGNGHSAYSLDDELRRGCIIPPVPNNAPPAPQLGDQNAWRAFVDEVMMELPPQMDEDEMLAAQAWQSYQHTETLGDWDWVQWLGEQSDVYETSPSSSTGVPPPVTEQAQETTSMDSNAIE